MKLSEIRKRWEAGDANHWDPQDAYYFACYVIPKLLDVADAATAVTCGHAKRLDCDYFSVPDCDMRALTEALEELESE